MDIELRPFFQCLDNEMCLIKIKSDSFPEYHTDDNLYLIAANLPTLKDVSLNYECTVAPVLKKVRQYKDCKSCLFKVLCFPLLICKKQEGEDGEMLHEIEYLTINLKQAMTQDKRRFMLALQKVSSTHINYLDLPALQGVIEFKWKTYTKGYLIRQFMIFLCFLSSMILEVILTSELYKYTIVEDKNTLVLMICHAICCSVILIILCQMV